MLTIRLEKSSDAAAREALLDAAYGPVRFEKPSERLRSGRAPAGGPCMIATETHAPIVDIEPLLSKVARPARYVGGEWNQVTKDWEAMTPSMSPATSPMACSSSTPVIRLPAMCSILRGPDRR